MKKFLSLLLPALVIPLPALALTPAQCRLACGEPGTSLCQRLGKNLAESTLPLLKLWQSALSGQGLPIRNRVTTVWQDEASGEKKIKNEGLNRDDFYTVNLGLDIFLKLTLPEAVAGRISLSTG